MRQGKDSACDCLVSLDSSLIAVFDLLFHWDLQTFPDFLSFATCRYSFSANWPGEELWGPHVSPRALPCPLVERESSSPYKLHPKGRLYTLRAGTTPNCRFAQPFRLPARHKTWDSGHYMGSSSIFLIELECHLTWSPIITEADLRHLNPVSENG